MMGLLAIARAFFSANGIVVALTAGLAVTVLLWDRGRINAAENRGAEQVRVNVEKQNDEAIKEADAVGAASRNPGAAGVRDPYAGPGVRDGEAIDAGDR